MQRCANNVFGCFWLYHLKSGSIRAYIYIYIYILTHIRAISLGIPVSGSILFRFSNLFGFVLLLQQFQCSYPGFFSHHATTLILLGLGRQLLAIENDEGPWKRFDTGSHGLFSICQQIAVRPSYCSKIGQPKNTKKHKKTNELVGKGARGFFFANTKELDPVVAQNLAHSEEEANELVGVFP